LATLATVLPSVSVFYGQLPTNALKQKDSVSIADPFNLCSEQSALEIQLRSLVLQKPLRMGVFAIEPRSGRYINIDASEQYAAASMIKLPVLVSALRAIDNHNITPNKMLTIRTELVTGGSGHLQWRPIGTKVPLLEVLRLMIVFSDNTATNMIIDALGGREMLNKDFQAWGLKQTKINNYLGDFTGTNKTSPYDLVYLLGRVDRGELISDQSRQWMLDILKKTRVRTLLSPGLGPGAQLAHKTGDIGSMIGDAGIVTTSDGKKYYVAVQVERPHNDLRANAVIKDVSKLVYACFINSSQLSADKAPITKQALLPYNGFKTSR